MFVQLFHFFFACLNLSYLQIHPHHHGLDGEPVAAAAQEEVHPVPAEVTPASVQEQPVQE